MTAGGPRAAILADVDRAIDALAEALRTGARAAIAVRDPEPLARAMAGLGDLLGFIGDAVATVAVLDASDPAPAPEDAQTSALN